MPIPALDFRGLLPEGIHDATIHEVKSHFVTSVYRLALFDNFLQFLSNEIGNINAPVYIAGSFLSDKDHPNDIEITVAINLAFLQSFPKESEKLFKLQSERDRLKSQYRMDFYISLEMEGYNDFRLFFQYVGEKTASAKGIDAKDKRGIIKVII